MRTLPAPIDEAYASGIHVGSNKIVWRVTVEPDWELHEAFDVFDLGSLPLEKSPIRWWQRQANDQVEVEIPNIKSVNLDENIDQIAGTCKISINNVWMDSNMSGRNDRIGFRGYFTPTQNATPEAVARWGEDDSPWREMLEANAMLRVYKGIAGPIDAGGAPTLSVAAAVDGGYLMLDGVYLIDDWVASTSGVLTLTCRNMGVLAIDQPIYPPLVPDGLYPLEYYRWDYDVNDVNSAPVDGIITRPGATVAPGNRRTYFALSSNDIWYPGQLAAGGANLHGHRGRDAFDGRLDTFWLSVGSASPGLPFACDWLETTCGEPMNAVNIATWGRGYTMYVSVMENGVWQGSSIIPYSPPVGNPWGDVDHGADIPFVASFGIPDENFHVYNLPRVYQAQRVRYTFRNGTRSQWGPNYYRSGVREVHNRLTIPATSGGSSISVTVQPVFFAGDALIDPDDLNRTGYVTVSSHGQIDMFGDVELRPLTAGPANTSGAATAVRLTDGGEGYYVLDDHGRIAAYGDIPYHGDPYGAGFIFSESELGTFDMALTHTGDGYWVLANDGTVYAFGDAASYPPPTPTGDSVMFSIESDPSGMGYWVMDTNGQVTARGSATDFGSWSETVLDHEPGQPGPSAGRIRANVDGDGYWILLSSGRVQAFGAADDHGEITTPYEEGTDWYQNWSGFFPSPTGGGYLLMQGNGRVVEFGDAFNFGGPVPGSQGTIRRNGNILDYVDMIKDIALWCGWWYAEELDDRGYPVVFGNLESTGAFPPDAMPLEFFDKQAPADVFKKIAEIVGYIVGINFDGSLFFTTPNWWNFGNFLPDGTHTATIPELDERWNLFSADVRGTKQFDRSEIVISTVEPTEDLADTITTRFTPPNQARLRGMVRPAVVTHGALSDRLEQQVMAELAAMHMWFRQRTATITGPDNPGIGMNDQVRLLERNTGETNIFYVLSKTSSWEAETGYAEMTLQAHWLGDYGSWAVALEEPGVGVNDRYRFFMSEETAAELRRRGIDLDGIGDLPIVPHQAPIADPPDDEEAGGPQPP